MVIGGAGPVRIYASPTARATRRRPIRPTDVPDRSPMPRPRCDTARTMSPALGGDTRMTLADEIGKRGFRRWYERQLIESHLYLVLGFLSMIVAFGCVEAVTTHGGALKAIPLLVAAFGSGIVAWLSWNRYAAMMARAWRLAGAATCKSCGTYGLLRVVGGSRSPRVEYDANGVIAPADPNADWARVQCKHCGNEWTL